MKGPGCRQNDADDGRPGHHHPRRHAVGLEVVPPAAEEISCPRRVGHRRVDQRRLGASRGILEPVVRHPERSPLTPRVRTAFPLPARLRGYGGSILAPPGRLHLAPPAGSGGTLNRTTCPPPLSRRGRRSPQVKVVTPVSNHRPSEQAVIRTFNPACPRIRKIGDGRDRPPLSIPFND